MDLVAVEIETAGVICKEGIKWLDEIGKQLIDKTGNRRAMCYLMQRISMGNTKR